MPERKEGDGVGIGVNLPVYQRISGYALGASGWKYVKGNNYEKNGKSLNFDGVYWTIGGNRFEFMHELPEQLNEKK